MLAGLPHDLLESVRNRCCDCQMRCSWHFGKLQNEQKEGCFQGMQSGLSVYSWTGLLGPCFLEDQGVGVFLPGCWACQSGAKGGRTEPWAGDNPGKAEAAMGLVIRLLGVSQHIHPALGLIPADGISVAEEPSRGSLSR